MIIDAKSHVPIYKQIVEQVYEAIDLGIYRAGEMLPSLRSLAVEIRVNPNTVQRAYDELEREGVIVSRRGVGVFVAQRRKLAARGPAQKKAAKLFQEAIRTCRGVELPPERIRGLFDDALNHTLRQARKQR